MAISKTHYEVLGVHPSATTDEIRTVFRSLARQNHPDLADDVSSARSMAEINQAWSVLSDPSKRRDYDRSISSEEVAPPASPQTNMDYSGEKRPTFVQPARFPWRGILFFGVVAVIGVLLMHGTARPAVPEVPDNLLAIGSCIKVDTERFVKEVSCQDQNDGVVRQLVALDQDCPSDTMGFIDRQGLGIACIDSSLLAGEWESQGP
jgi:hypothetical protein